MSLQRYYRTVLQDGQTRGLLRTDGGGPDTPYTAEMLARNFERVAFFSEYADGFNDGPGGSAPLRRWSSPVRFGLHFGATTDPADKARDTTAVRGYVARLARITRHPLSVSSAPVGRTENFSVLFVGEDDKDETRAVLRSLNPALSRIEIDKLLSLDRTNYCVVTVYGSAGNDSDFVRAIALIRTEQPDLLRLSCIHEELAQGLGLANDSPYARPSIFNDDDEFALLTSHDEKLLEMLYNPRLQIGMLADEARGIVRELARAAMGTDL